MYELEVSYNLEVFQATSLTYEARCSLEISLFEMWIFSPPSIRMTLGMNPQNRQESYGPLESQLESQLGNIQRKWQLFGLPKAVCFRKLVKWAEWFDIFFFERPKTNRGLIGEGPFFKQSPNNSQIDGPNWMEKVDYAESAFIRLCKRKIVCHHRQWGEKISLKNIIIAQRNYTNFKAPL